MAAEPGEISYVLYAKDPNYNYSIFAMTDTNSAKVPLDYTVKVVASPLTHHIVIFMLFYLLV